MMQLWDYFITVSDFWESYDATVTVHFIGSYIFPLYFLVAMIRPRNYLCTTIILSNAERSYVMAYINAICYLLYTV